MTKTFCDHCGKEISGNNINELGSDDCFYDYDAGELVGYGCVLCGECWEERSKKLVEFDRAYLNLNGGGK